jgi:conjugative transfer signal peptidase TraF
MTIRRTHRGTRRRQLYGACGLIITGLAFAGGLAIAGFAAGIRINTTPSEAIGLWQIVPLASPLRPGQRVFICLPPNALVEEARERGYLRSGLCPGGVGPLIKSVVAVGGQEIKVTDRLLIDGIPLPHSKILTTDGKGRLLQHDRGGIVPAGAVYLHSAFKLSWDSRYFGAVPKSGVLGLARKVLTYAP